MTRQRKRQSIRDNSASIINDADQCFTAICVGHFNPMRASIDGILDQFLNGGSRAFDHFTRSNPIDRSIIKLTDNRLAIAYVGGKIIHTPTHSIKTRDSATHQNSVNQQKTRARTPGVKSVLDFGRLAF